MTIGNLTRARTLITDGTERAALAAARSLVASGHTVYVTASKRTALAGVSHGVNFERIGSDPLADPERYAAEIGALARRLEIRVILPVTDPSVEALLEFSSGLSPEVSLPLPSLAAYRQASDKYQMLNLARMVGLAVPETITLFHPDDGSSVPGATFFPAFVKPHRSVVAADGGAQGRQKLGVVLAQSVADCRAKLADLPASAYPVMLQQRVVGPGEGMFALRWNGGLVAQFAHRRLREKPPGGGVSVYRESIAMPPALETSGRRILERLDWRGVAMIECKRDLKTGRHLFMEINGRLWGSLQLAIDAGVDFPGLLVACALGDRIESSNFYRPGVRSRWFWGDVDNLYLRLTRSADSLGMEGGSQGRVGAIQEFLNFFRAEDSEEIWRRNDPQPFLLETFERFGLVRP